ncbi:MAG: 30S ribosome-binding factor RbfA [Acidobacteria bacterium]|nr:30S ribosome-binding factor RbfA [Acidobacteriota bacterium]
MDERRNQRLTESLREEISELITLEMSDPRVDGVTVTEVQLSPDSSSAIVRLAISGEQSRHKSVIAALDHAKPFLKRELGLRVDVFRLPDLRFEADMRVDRNQRLQYLLKKVRKGRPRDAQSIEKTQKNSEA